MGGIECEDLRVILFERQMPELSVTTILSGLEKAQWKGRCHASFQIPVIAPFGEASFLADVPSAEEATF